ncbi:uncharacterized protein LOC141903407 [Tubulanus polymorphus]|uniref:uncharacterized protein LOC141903407 n=1 Tax=Tubulanus polymorphus TaxID=672921 RepID=UPI003DA51AB5
MKWNENDINDSHYYPFGILKYTDESSLPIFYETATVFPNGIPLDEPTCGYSGEKCMDLTYILIGVLGGLAVLSLIIVGIIYRRETPLRATTCEFDLENKLERFEIYED